MSEIKKCRAHDGGEHCWHEDGNTGFRGKYETFEPVKCCHCGSLATRNRKITSYEPRQADTATTGNEQLKPAQNPYERAVREAEEWWKSEPQSSLLRELIQRAETIGGHRHDDGPWQPRIGFLPCDEN